MKLPPCSRWDQRPNWGQFIGWQCHWILEAVADGEANSSLGLRERSLPSPTERMLRFRRKQRGWLVTSWAGFASWNQDDDSSRCQVARWRKPWNRGWRRRRRGRSCRRQRGWAGGLATRWLHQSSHEARRSKSKNRRSWQPTDWNLDFYSSQSFCLWHTGMTYSNCFHGTSLYSDRWVVWEDTDREQWHPKLSAADVTNVGRL